MPTRETELPGVGTKHTIDLETGGQLVVVEHRVGRWELARADSAGNTTALLQLQSGEAAELGRIFSHAQPVEEDARQRVLFEQIGIEWYTLEDPSDLIGQTLQESGIRERTGSNVIAILRSHESIASPPPDTRFLSGDTLVLIGHPDQIKRFLDTFTRFASPE